jgi:hypothetical protein
MKYPYTFNGQIGKRIEIRNFCLAIKDHAGTSYLPNVSEHKQDQLTDSSLIKA